MKIRPAGAELFRADRQTDGHDVATSTCLKSCVNNEFCETGTRREDISIWEVEKWLH